tara:strand:+ start:5927 stop:6946 length:1020 start_codon:yes stop_codon:yes gene_type:complete
MTNLPKDHPTIKHRKVGVLIVNLGTPDGTDYRSIRRYLKEFLSDRRVIDINKYLWWLILNGIILTFRPSKTAQAYKKIWNEAMDESPLKTYTRSQCTKLQQSLNTKNIFWAMRYGNPSISQVLLKMREIGLDQILIFPLYPQYAAPTTATVNDKVYSELAKMRWQPAIRTMPPFYDNPKYINALKNSVESHLGSLDWSPEILLTSYHGLPKRYLLSGDPYHCHCHKTTRLLKDSLNSFTGDIQLSFQSRFGREEWLKPYTEETVINLAKTGIKRIALISPAFISDCVETLEELNIGIKEVFIENGGEKFTLIPCLNDNDHSIDLLSQLIKNELLGWSDL